jgi:hypothetical protein
MNTQASIQMMQTMKLTGMADAYQAITKLPVDKQPLSHECIATLLDAEQQHRTFKRTNMYVRLSKLRYQANMKDISYEPSRNLDKQTIAALADCSYIQHPKSTQYHCHWCYWLWQILHHLCSRISSLYDGIQNPVLQHE